MNVLINAIDWNIEPNAGCDDCVECEDYVLHVYTGHTFI